MKTMKQALMQLLLKQWTTPLDALNKVGCMSLSQRCGEFNRVFGDWCQMHFEQRIGSERPARIHSKWVKLTNGKRVKAYRAIK